MYRKIAFIEYDVGQAPRMRLRNKQDPKPKGGQDVEQTCDAVVVDRRMSVGYGRCTSTWPRRRDT